MVVVDGLVSVWRRAICNREADSIVIYCYMNYIIHNYIIWYDVVTLQPLNEQGSRKVANPSVALLLIGSYSHGNCQHGWLHALRPPGQSYLLQQQYSFPPCSQIQGSSRSHHPRPHHDHIVHLPRRHVSTWSRHSRGVGVLASRPPDSTHCWDLTNWRGHAIADTMFT